MKTNRTEKHRTMITIDMETWLHLHTKGINISNACNTYLQQLVKSEEKETTTITKLQEERNTLEEARRDLQMKLGINEERLKKAEYERELASKKHDEESDKEYRAIRASGFLEEIFDH